MTATISDVARLANVSKATVSAVINNRPGISQKTRDRVLEVASHLNYSPNPLARSLSINKTNTVGLVIKEIDNPFFAQIMKAVYDACNQRGYTVLLGSSELSPEKEIQSLLTLVNQRVDGLILAPLCSEDCEYVLLARIRDRFPLVTLGEIPNFKTSFVDAQNEEGAYEAVKFLIRAGHRRIAYFSGPAHSSHSRERARGYRRAFLESSLPFNSADVIEVGSSIENGYTAGKRLLEKADIPTAVLCYNDLVAMGLINAVLEAGKAVPDDVAVIGFDNIEYGAHFTVPLTTVNMPAYAMGKKAAEMVFERLDPDAHEVEITNVRFNADLIHRKSGGKA